MIQFDSVFGGASIYVPACRVSALMGPDVSTFDGKTKIRYLYVDGCHWPFEVLDTLDTIRNAFRAMGDQKR